MPSVTYNGQSFSIDGRRFWILAASLQYARTPRALWADRIAAARQAGFNTIETAVPWALHEPRKGRFTFEGDVDLRHFIGLCAEAGMRVILRAGPNIGNAFDGGALPGWLIDQVGSALREASEVFLEHASRWFRKLISSIADLQATQGGPIILVQSEHAWTCTNHRQMESYLHAITRFLRENGVSVPLTNANDLWQESPETIDTWRGGSDLLAHLRQLRTVQPDAPRIVSAFELQRPPTWNAQPRAKSAVRSGPEFGHQTLRRLAEILAAGAQPVVSFFHGGTNFGFIGGRLTGMGIHGGFAATDASEGSMINQAGTPGEAYFAAKRLLMFANHFGPVFAELDPDSHPVVLDPGHNGLDETSIVPLRGPQGRITFVFGKPGSTASLVLDDGIRLPVELGDQPVAWHAMGVDLQGAGRLDFSNVRPWAIVDRSVVVFYGPAKSHAFISIGSVPLELNVPADDAKPVVVEHAGVTVALLNERQVDAALVNERHLYVGVSGLSPQGEPLPHEQFAKAWVIGRDASLEALAFPHSGGGKKSAGAARLPSLGAWSCAPASALASGTSPRYASLDGPQPLSSCGAPTGYGWYRMTVDSAGRHLAHLPEAEDRVQLFMDGEPLHLFGVGPGAEPAPFELRLGKGPHHIAALVDNFGRACEGNDMGRPKGLFGPMLAVSKLAGSRGKAVEAKPVNPFALRGFISGRTAGQLSDTQQAQWTLQHTRKSPLLIDASGAAVSGAFVLNDVPLAYHAGATGAGITRIMVGPDSNPPLKRGKNVLRFAPDPRQDDPVKDILAHVTIYECTSTLSEPTGWAFAKWEPPAENTYESNRSGARQKRGTPCWWRATFELAAAHAPLLLNLSTMSKGQVFLNGHNLGRYFSNTATVRPVGPQTSLLIPEPWLRSDGQPNEVVIFDEHGFDATSVRLQRA